MKKTLAFLTVLCLLVSLFSFAGAMAEPAETLQAAPLQVGDVVHGFRVTKTQAIDFLDAELFLMEHEKSGAQLAYIACDDIDRSFSASFRTVGEGDKGLPHVFEHSALSGSEKYPSSNLIFQMISQTYNTFINATTYPLNTTYPCSSLSQEQLLKYVDVYMSGVLHPLLLTDERAMQREAYRYELADADADLTVTGTVYSEMQGVFASITSAAMYNMFKLTYPGSNMGNITGGVPSDILTMTYQELLDFHAKYYHPSNMLMTLYGDLDYERFLALLDSEYLSDYTKQDIAITDDGYQPFTGYREQVYEFPVTADADTDRGTLMYYTYIPDGATFEDGLVGSVVAAALNMESSPLQQLARERLPEASINCMMQNQFPVPALIFVAANVNPSDKELFKSVVDDAISQTASNGIDKNAVERLISNYAFQLLLMSETEQVGVNLASSMAVYWGCAGDPLAFFTVNDFNQNLQAYVDDGSIDAFAEKFLLTPAATAMAITVPTPGLAEQQSAQLAEELSQKKAAMSDEEIADLVQKTADFAAWQQQNEQISLIDQVKVVDVATLPEEVNEPVVQDTTVDGVRVITSDTGMEGVVWATTAVNANAIPFDMLHDYALFTSLLGNMPTEKYTLEELENEIGLNTYDLSFTADARLPKGGGYEPYFGFEMTVLDSKIGQAYDLAEEILFHTDFSDVQRLQARASEMYAGFKLSLSQSPHSFAMFVGSAAANEDELYNYYLGGFAYMDYLGNVAAMETDELTMLSERLNTIRDLLLAKNGVVLTCASDARGIEANNARAMELVNRLDSATNQAVDYTPDLPKLPRTIAIVVDGNMQYNAIVAKTDDLVDKQDGKLLALNNIVYDKLLVPTLRFQNGAYGAMNAIGETTAYLLSYRDPELAKTYDVYATLSAQLREMTLTQEELDGFITSAYSALATPEGPLSSAINAIERSVEGKREIGETQREMQELKQFAAEDVATYAPLYDLLYENGVHITAGGADAIEANKDMFELVIGGSAE